MRDMVKMAVAATDYTAAAVVENPQVAWCIRLAWRSLFVRHFGLFWHLAYSLERKWTSLSLSGSICVCVCVCGGKMQ